ncbi:GAP family protein [Streptomyces canus]|uniref:GAP family protein n=1 Tax=Streptomyces canus TaxID=58343 RepID=UPI002E2D8B2E|nr:GAP family protein [Streptomyces canus]
MLFVVMAVKQFMGRPREGRPAQTPGWMEAVDRFTPGKAFGLAAALAVANPKNLALLIAGALSIASTSAGVGGKATAAIVMVLVASLCTTVPLAVYLVGGERSVQILNGWKSWMATHNVAIITTVLGVLGAKYIGDATSALTS